MFEENNPITADPRSISEILSKQFCDVLTCPLRNMLNEFFNIVDPHKKETTIGCIDIKKKKM